MRVRMAVAGAVALCGVVVGCSSGTAGGTAAGPVTVTVSGANSVRLGGTTQFTAVVTNTANTAVNWQVNGIAGGNTVAGAISAGGLYTPPAVIPSPNTVTVTAVSVAAGTAGSEIESILNPVPVVTNVYATLNSGTSYALDVLGSGYVTGSVIQVSGAAVGTTFISSGELKATITIAAGVTAVPVAVVNPNPGTVTSAAVNAAISLTTIAQAARLLDQATFGPTLNDIGHVQQVGIDGYLAEQFAVPTTLLADIPATLPVNCVAANTPVPCLESEWWQVALTGNDQLRQRVAFALSEIAVVSSVSASVNARSVTPYHNMLANDAFGNYFNVMKDVTLSPAMGAYLNMLNSDKAPVGQIPNENYARELMQLFSIGLYMLNQDGTLQLDASGNPIPTYGEAQIEQFAKVYTGWTYANATGGVPNTFPAAANYFYPMAAVESHHDMTAKTLLNGTVLPAGQSSTQDLQAALTNIFNHQNVAPFISKQLIQHLVASNPSPAYVGRVAAVFANDGTGVRGNMKTVVKAILTDVEARAGDTNASFDGGHLREPMLWMTGVMRGLGYVNTDANQNYFNLSNYSTALNQRPYRSGSVFNFFSPSYLLPGTTTLAPEFGLENTATAILRLTLADRIVFNRLSGFNVDLSAGSTLGKMATGTAGPGNLADALSVIFMHGQMPASMRTTLVNATSGLTDPAQRVRVAVYLVITSSLYKVEH